jgi:hypothetical protein
MAPIAMAAKISQNAGSIITNQKEQMIKGTAACGFVII